VFSRKLNQTWKSTLAKYFYERLKYKPVLGWFEEKRFAYFIYGYKTTRRVIFVLVDLQTGIANFRLDEIKE